MRDPAYDGLRDQIETGWNCWWRDGDQMTDRERNERALWLWSADLVAGRMTTTSRLKTMIREAIFAAIAETGSQKKAAQMLGVSPRVVNYHVKKFRRAEA